MTMCGSSSAGPNAAAATPTAIGAGSAAHGPTAVTATDARDRTTGATAWKPCHLPTGCEHFLNLDAAM
ncbi:hypothetical protein [Streptomyces sp. NPDC040750]|uniref:hypothetical protein n=1 Tax=Streptomyces sp. NPDC040750 TaxID=3154491 RepID=UPI003407E724